MRSVPVFFALIGTSLFAAPFAVPQEPPVPRQTAPQLPGGFVVDPGVAPTLPPGISPDGNRWVEVEVTVFRAETNSSDEVANPGRLKLSYFPNARLLSSPLDSYAYPFEADQPPAPFAAQPTPQPASARPLDDLLAQDNAAPEEIVPPKPMYDFSVLAAPGVPGSFKVLDLARDPFVRLDAAVAKFSGMDRNLEQSPDYQVLWHEVWRQPLLERGDVKAVVVQAGETLDEHTALEGSLRLSRTGDRAHLDLNLWLSEFGVNDADDAARWQLPAVPEAARPKKPEPEAVAAQQSAPGLFPLQPPQQPLNAVPEPERGIVRIWQVQGAEDMAIGELRYLDHPVLGVLIEARPYLLPEAVTPAVSEDF
jgi:hypothetical protein